MRAQCAVRWSPGITLLEMLVVLTVLGVVLGVSGLAIESLRVPPESQELRDLQRARAEAIQSGAQRTAHGVRFLTDGRAIGPHVDPLTGIPDAK
jgi:prepilin-type N-terminal cleavage/methylation domain-containing protein